VGGVEDADAGGSHALSQMAEWLELFYDLVFVAAILIFSTAASHHGEASHLLRIIAVFVALWWVWFSTTLSMNRFPRHDTVHRLLILAQMLVIAFVALEVNGGVRRDEDYLALTFGVLIAILAAMYWRAARDPGPGAGFAGRMAGLHAAAAACFFVAAALPERIQIPLVIVGFAVMIVPALARLTRLGDFPPLDEPHLVERIGEFTMIVCGESFVKVAIVATGALNGIDAVTLAFQFLLTFALWAAYFEDIPHAGVLGRRLGPWTLFHLVAQICIAGVAIVVSKLADIGLLDHIPNVEILALTGLLVGFYLCLAGIGWSTRRRPLGPLAGLRVVTALVVGAVGTLAWAVPWVHLTESVIAFTVVAVLHAALVGRFRRGSQVCTEAELALSA